MDKIDTHKKNRRINYWRKKGADIPDNMTYEEFYIIFMNETHCKRCGELYPDETITHDTHKKNLTMDRGIMCHQCNQQTKQPPPKTYNKK